MHDMLGCGQCEASTVALDSDRLVHAHRSKMNTLPCNRTCSQASPSNRAVPLIYRRQQHRVRSSVECFASMKPALLINSCTGKMGQAVGEAAIRAGVELVPYTFSSAGGSPTVEVAGRTVTVVPPGQARIDLIKQLKQQHPNLMVVDYTVPDVIHAMVDFYVEHRVPFVMGTTGGDRERINKQVSDSGVYAVIAPNMGKQIVAFQATMETMATNFPGAFSGYKLRVVESHQSSKKDTSGTAKAVVKSFQGLGIPFSEDQIELVRKPDEQVNLMKVPKDALLGHAFHTYQLVSPDGSVMFEFQHNVVGRTTYAEGTVDACLFLARQIEQGAPKTLYNMIDVLRAGSMR